MNRATLDLWVGVFVAIGLGALLFLALGLLAASMMVALGLPVIELI